MAAQRPEHWPDEFTRSLNAGDLDGVVALYDAEARFADRSGEVLVGRERIRGVLDGLIRGKTQLEGRVRKAITSGDVAILYTDFQGTTTDPEGQKVDMRSEAIEVLQRQPDGSWLLIIGDPNGRA
jgi:uncharacterized protein (TIGR02246 family)